LNGAHDNVFATLVPTPGFVKHAIGLAYARRVAQKNLEFRAPTLVFFGLHLLEEALGTRFWQFGDTHSMNRPTTV
jgi:hypothetical protein